MSDEKSRLDQELEELGRLRDEIRVKAHLGRLEAEERWEELERRWEDLEAKARQVARESGEALQDVRSAAGLLVEELRGAYQDIRRRLTS